MPASVEFLNSLTDELERAAAANRTTPGRKGSLVHLGAENCTDLLVGGDLHGNTANFRKLVKAANLDAHPQRHLVLQEVVHGGPAYPNQGCMSHALLEQIAKLKVKYPDRFHFLLCNHELSEATGVQMLKGGISQNYLFAAGVDYAYGPAAPKIVEGYHAFILSCPLGVRLKNGVMICHSYPDRAAWKCFDRSVFFRDLTRPDFEVGGAAHALVWGRDYEQDHARTFAEHVRASLIVTGHEPVPAGFRKANDYQIVLDATGSACYACLIPAKKSWTADSVLSRLRAL